MRENSLSRRLKTLVPVMSAGIRSGVNWMRLNSQAMDCASARVSRVFANPGTPSMSPCWLQSTTMRALRTASSCPITTLWISDVICAMASWNCSRFNRSSCGLRFH